MPNTSDDKRRAAEMPLYRRLAATLQQEIERGRYTANAPLPAERELAASFSVSRDTVRKAIRLLEEQGVLYSDHGRGTFAAPEAVRQMSRFLDSFTDDALKRGGVPGQRILGLDAVAADMAVASLLHLEAGAPLLRLRRLRLLNGTPVGLQDSWLHLPAGQTIRRQQLEAKGSLYRLLVEDLDLHPSECLESLSATAAGEDEAGLLGVPAGSPLLACERITLSDRRQPIEYCEMRYVPSYRYKTRINKWSLG
ncbi:GntR family transcriptional regulator [Massilia sp. YIM B02443]|uniref:GntR family transcriptional regulator n=1 Tax=Massilia sp. YIM B02443 TaxID=3050127 RepID=UPI0025B6A855|nr:GntR family transcriptional regulator [Massilia sp. YIM B02443]MDN4037605.1 GntR family transcriptional regulator [Massilia sp. YIM B02443]